MLMINFISLNHEFSTVINELFSRLLVIRDFATQIHCFDFINNYIWITLNGNILHSIAFNYSLIISSFFDNLLYEFLSLSKRDVLLQRQSSKYILEKSIFRILWSSFNISKNHRKKNAAWLSIIIEKKKVLVEVVRVAKNK